ncbi:MAG: AAA family ATPase [Candidatus Moranbacteria bacterium]|nr:AAA family ATPase [Candidatus Moranbacteria bacterium]
MKKIIIIGSCGAGKSTFARNLHGILGIEVIHLDQHFWKPKWTRTESEEWRARVKELMKKDSWIMDGNYRSTMDLRLHQADTIIWLDFSRLKCFWGILKRRWKNNRTDNLNQCRERITFELVKWVLWNFPRYNRKDIIKITESSKENKNVYILKSKKEIGIFLKNIKKDK